MLMILKQLEEKRMLDLYVICIVFIPSRATELSTDCDFGQHSICINTWTACFLWRIIKYSFERR